MALLSDLERSIQSIIHALISIGIADQFRIPSVRAANQYSGDIGFGTGVDLSWVLRDQPYRNLYDELVRREMFHVLLPDGGILQFMYKVYLGKVTKHRLAFYPSPGLLPFDADVVTYLQDSVWGHVVSEFQMPVVVRFDYDADERHFVPVSHSYSHMTLGQYPRCRIPVSGPIPPWAFAELVLRNFYNRCFDNIETATIFQGIAFDRTLVQSESTATHLALAAV